MSARHVPPIKNVKITYCHPIGISANMYWIAMGDRMSSKTDIWQGTLASMVLKTLETMAPLHGYGITRRIEQTSDDLLWLNYGTFILHC
jgi:hypothetical protein